MKNVLLVFGGLSYEHDISVVTAAQIFNKTRIKDYKLVPLYISKDEKYYIYDIDEFVLSDFASNNFIQNKKKFKEVVLISNEKGILFSKSKFGLKEYIKVNLAIFACHGGAGENGKIASMLEGYGIYSDVGNFDSLAICMNKFFFKNIMNSLKVPVVIGDIITKEEYNNNLELVTKKIEKMGYPLILKPNNGGSSIGVFVVENEEEFKLKFNEALEFDDEILIEKYIQNTREFNIAVIGDRDSFNISEIDEPIKHNDVLSFADKYLSSDSSKSLKIDKGLKNSMVNLSRKFPADLDEDISSTIKFLATNIFKSLNLRGVVRIDFLYSEKSNDLYVCEVNTIPGSLAFYFFNKDEIIINDFVLKLINIAEKYKERDFCINKEFITNILK